MYQTKVNEQKVRIVELLKNMISDASNFVFTDYRGVTVQEITALRNKLRENDAEYRVVKNRFAKFAFEQLSIETDKAYLEGPTAIALMRGDPAQAIKIIVEFGKTSPVIIKGALVDAQLYSADEVVAFSKLPSKEVLLAQLMSTMQAAPYNFVCGLSSIATKLVRVLQAVEEKKRNE